MKIVNVKITQEGYRRSRVIGQVSRWKDVIGQVESLLREAESDDQVLALAETLTSLVDYMAETVSILHSSTMIIRREMSEKGLWSSVDPVDSPAPAGEDEENIPF